MTKTEFLKQCESGFPGVVVEYRSSRVDHIAWRDKQTGKAREAFMLRHTVEMGASTLSVAERKEDDWTGKGYAAPFKKGQACVLTFSDWRTERGATTVRGSLEPLA